MIKILVLEDEAYRQDIFSKRLIGTDFMIVSMAQDCIDLLQKQKWDVLFLDHDLDTQNQKDPGTGYDVACWLEQYPEFKPDNIVIHSMNNIGAPKMLAALPEAVYMPACFLKLRVKNGKLHLEI